MVFHSKERLSRFLAFSLTLLILLASLSFLPLPAAAEPVIPQPSEDFFFYDEAGILSHETRSHILEKNNELSAHNIQIAVMVANTLPVSGYAQRVEYLQDVIRSWKLGGEQGKGLLLAVSISDEDYLAVAGEGLQALFTSERLKSLLDEYMEPDFSARAFESALLKTFDQAAAQAPELAAAAPDGTSASHADGAPAEDEESEKEGLSPLVLGIIIAAAVLGVIILSLALLSRSRRRSRDRLRRRTAASSRATNLRRGGRSSVSVRSGRYSGASRQG